MGAETKWYVQVLRTAFDVIEVEAITSDDARQEASKADGVVTVLNVKHWSEVEATD